MRRYLNERLRFAAQMYKAKPVGTTSWNYWNGYHDAVKAIREHLKD